MTFTLDKSDFGFYDNRGRFVVEPGDIDVYAGDSSSRGADAVVHGDRLSGALDPPRASAPAGDPGHHPLAPTIRRHAR